jgi:hypothetical protein
MTENKSIPQIIKDVKKRTDLIRYPFDEFWFIVGFNECEKIQEEMCEITNEDMIDYFKGKDIPKADRLLLKTAKNNFKAGQKERDAFWKKKIKDVFEFQDIKLLLTDIKDKEGKKFELSDEIMEIVSIWWEQESKQLLKELLAYKECLKIQEEKEK